MIEAFDPSKLDPQLYWYDIATAEEAVRFIEKYLRHFGAQHEGKPFVLLPWQRDVIRQFFGVKRVIGGVQTDKDRYRILYIESGKSTGKTPLAAAIGLYVLRKRKEARPYVISLASTYEQAADLLSIAKNNVGEDGHPAMQKGVVVNKREILYPSRDARWKILASNNKGKSGTPASLYIVDELHEFDPTKGQAIKVIEANLKKRHNSKLVIITNAGSDKITPCGEWHDRAVAIQTGKAKDDSVLALVLAADPDDDISKPETWRKANPSIGTTIDEEDYAEEYRKTIGNKAQEIIFRRLWLAQWTRSVEQWLNPQDIANCFMIDSYDDKGKPVYSKRLPDDVRKLPLFVGFDLGPVDDITAAVQVYVDAANDMMYVEPKMWLPRAAADEDERMFGVPYELWRGSSTTGAPKYIDILNGKALTREQKQQIADEMLEAFPRPEVAALDASFASDVVTALSNGGWLCEPIGSSAYVLNQATRDLGARIFSGRIRMIYNPCYVWQLSNCGIDINPDEKAKPIRLGGHSGTNPRKYDAVMATLYAMARACIYLGVLDAPDDSPKPLDLSAWGGELPDV